jgi:hypothetical protein
MDATRRHSTRVEALLLLVDGIAKILSISQLLVIHNKYHNDINFGWQALAM